MGGIVYVPTVRTYSSNSAMSGPRASTFSAAINGSRLTTREETVAALYALVDATTGHVSRFLTTCCSSPKNTVNPGDVARTLVEVLYKAHKALIWVE